MEKLIIPGTLPDLNKIIHQAKRHWAVYANEKRRQTHRIALLARQAQLPAFEHPVKVKFTWFCKDKRRDKDGVRCGAKYILDGLVLAQVLLDDGWAQIVGFEDDFVIDKKQPRVVVELT